MFVLVVNIKIKPENVERWMKMALENAREARKEPGCKQFDVLFDPKDKTKVMLYEIYNDEKAFEAHQQTPHFKKYLAEAAAGDGLAQQGVQVGPTFEQLVEDCSAAGELADAALGRLTHAEEADNVAAVGVKSQLTR